MSDIYMEVCNEEKAICNVVCLWYQHLYFCVLWKKTESTAGATSTPTSKSTSETADTITPEQELPPASEPAPVGEFVELTEDEITDLYTRAREYGQSLFYTGLIVEYYKYIGLYEVEVPVIVCYQAEEAKERFGGEWEYIPNIVVEIEEKKDLFGAYSYFPDFFQKHHQCLK